MMRRALTGCALALAAALAVAAVPIPALAKVVYLDCISPQKVPGWHDRVVVDFDKEQVEFNSLAPLRAQIGAANIIWVWPDGGPQMVLHRSTLTMQGYDHTGNERLNASWQCSITAAPQNKM